jgi:hypothetical protein
MLVGSQFFFFFSPLNVRIEITKEKEKRKVLKQDL